MDNKFSTTIDRIIEFIDYKGISKREFASTVGISHSLIGKANAIGSDKLEKILSSYPELSSEWLLTGKGDMLLSPVVTELKRYIKPIDDGQEVGLKSLVWLVWTGYEKQSQSDFSVNSFERLAKFLELASINVKTLQTAMEAEVMSEINSYRESGSLEFDEKEKSFMIPQAMVNLFSKYESAYKAISEPTMALMNFMQSPAIQKEIFEYVTKK